MTDTATLRPRLHPLLWAALAAILAIPLVAGAPWSAFDFVLVGALLAMLGAGVELGLNATSNISYRLGAILGSVTVFAILLANLAVGFVGEPENPLNLMYFAVPLVAVGGALLAGFHPTGMRNAMFAAASAQVLAGLIALGHDDAIVILTAIFGGAWLISGLLFAHAAKQAD